MVLSSRDGLERATEILTRATGAQPAVDEDDRTLVAPTPNGLDALVEVGRALQEAGIAVDDLSLRQPTLDEVFLTLTGSPSDDDRTSTTPAHRAPAEEHA